MNQGQSRRTSTPPWRLADVLELGKAALRRLVVGLVVALTGAAGWAALSPHAFGSRLPVTLVVAAVLLPTIPFLPVRRNGTTHIEQLVGANLAVEDSGTGGLTAMGTVLFVSLPMVALATVVSL